MQRNAIETIMGALVLLVAVVFLVFVYSSSSLGTTDGYEVTARFNKIDGISRGTDVRLSGIKVGTVVESALDPKTYLAVLRLGLDDTVKLPTDSTAKIQSDGLLGNAYVALEPGAEDAVIEPGGEIQYTQDPVNLVDLIGRFIFSAGDGKPAAAAEGGEGAATTDEGAMTGDEPPAPEPAPAP